MEKDNNKDSYKTTVNITQDMKRALEAIAAREDRSMSAVVRRAIQEYLENHKE